MAAPDQQPRDTADLELSIAPTSSGFSLTLRYWRSGDAGEDVRGPFPVALDPDQLRALSLDHANYGASLADQLFGDPQARREFIAICDGTFEAGERLRIRFHLHDPALHTIRWEMLHDPARGTPLARDTRLLVSRFISAERRGRVKLRPRGALRALVAVAAPTDLPDYHLAPIDASAEIARVRAALTGIAVDSLDDGQPCTLNTLGEQLRHGNGYDILYLVAHGALVDGQPQLYLAGDDRTAVVEDGNKLADLLGSLYERQPRLVVLASCESAGDGASETLAALGPLLAHVGVPAVLAMHGQISVITIEQLMPVFFRELLRDGLADRALAVARLAARARDDWWMPVLSTRLRDGRIWQQQNDSAAVPLGLAAPYRALNAFTIDDKDLFFGRDALIKEGYERWLASDRRFLAVVGASGSGKSSLAQAGLLPRLQRDLAEQRFAPRTFILRPGERPLRALRDALRGEGLSVPTDFAEHLATEPSLLLQALQQTPAQDSGISVTLLVIDQFEELFTLCDNEAERLAFDAALAHAEAQSSGTVSVIITLRSDFYPHSATLALREQIATYQVHVRNLLPAEMQQAISGPVRAVAGDGPPHFEAGLVEQMIEETGSSPGALPLLSVALSRLWEGGALDLITYRRLGGVRGALEQQAEQLYAELSADDQRAARQLLLQLVQLGEGSEDTRRRVPLDELTPAWRTPLQTQALVKKLSDARLVSTSEASEPVVEVSHEALIRGWGRLRSWLDEDRTIVSLHRQISTATQLWQDGKQDASLLWLGARLANIEEQGTALADRLTSDEHTFLTASRAEQQRQVTQRRRGQAISAIAVVAVIAVLALGGLASVIWRQGQNIAIERDNVQNAVSTVIVVNSTVVVANTEIAIERDAAQQAQQTAVVAQAIAVTAQTQVEQLQRETFSQSLAAQSLAIRAKRYNFALTLGIQALRIAQTIAADSAVRTWFSDVPYSVNSSFPHEDTVRGAIWNSNETEILTWSDDGKVRLWHVDGRPIITFDHKDKVIGQAGILTKV